MNLTERIRARAIELGFDLVGITPAGMAPHAKEYAAWVASGFAGEMAYMARDPDRRSDLRRVLPDAQSVIVVGLSYYTIDLPDDIKLDPSRGLIARYAWGLDYHDVMTPRLEELAQFVREESRRTGIPMPVETKVYVDTGPVLERDWALTAGLGFIGKNTCLINPRMGSWLFLGVIITTAELESDAPSSLRGSILGGMKRSGMESKDASVQPPHETEQSLMALEEIASRPSTARQESAAPLRALAKTNPVGCGTCTRCLTACPTDAFPAPYVLDARKCISYLTIELKGSIPLELRPLIGNHIFGCDICQDVCPWPMRFATPTKERSFYPIDVDRAAPKLIDLAQLSEEDFKRRFAGTPLLRSKRRGLLRNVAVALGNWGSTEAREALQRLANDPDPLIAEHAQWGLAR
jgi:epoxyqueuosine reductase